VILVKAALKEYQEARVKNGLRPQDGIQFIDDPDQAKKVFPNR
jgi:hypothetical protein